MKDINQITLSPEHSAYWLRCQSNPLAVMNTGSEEMDAFVGQSMGVMSTALKSESEVQRDCMGRPLPNNPTKKSESQEAVARMRL